MPADEGISARGGVERRQNPHGGGFTRPIGADEPDDLPRIGREGDVVDCLQLAEIPTEPMHFDRGLAQC